MGEMAGSETKRVKTSGPEDGSSEAISGKWRQGEGPRLITDGALRQTRSGLDHGSFSTGVACDDMRFIKLGSY